MNLNHLRVFAAVCEAKSFTGAAQRLGVDKAQVSRTVSALESAMGTTLLLRSTRALRLTPEGEALWARVVPALAELAAAMAAVPAQHELPNGEVVLTTTPDLGRTILAQHMPALRLRHPGVRLQVRLGHEPVDLLREGVDLALRVGRPPSSSLVARKLRELEAGFYASPRYLERRGAPRGLEALAGHECLWPPPKRGRKAFHLRHAPTATPAVTSEDFGFLAAVAGAGGGIAVLPAHLAERDVRLGGLVRVLPEVRLAGAPLYLLSRPPRTLPGRVAAVRGFLLEALASLPRPPPRTGGT